MSRSVVIAIVFSIVVILWLFSGAINTGSVSSTNAQSNASNISSTNTDAEGSRTNGSEDETSLFKVTVRDMQALAVADVITLQGDLEPARTITVKSETRGRVASIYVDNGTRVSKGEHLIALATDDRQARLEKAQAELKLREVQLEAAQKLETKRMVSGNQVEEAVANVAAAKAAVKQVKVEINQTRIKASFSGIVNHRHVELGDYLSPGDPIADLIDDAHIKIVARVPQQHISKLNIGQAVEAELLDGTTIDGELSYISLNADSATRTFRMEAIAQQSSKLRLGQSARVRLSLGEIMAHKVSSSILSLAADGNIYVNAVDEDNKVVRYAANIIKNDSDGVWLSGLPKQIRLIVVGQAFVAEGQTVLPVLESEANSETASTSKRKLTNEDGA